MSPIIIQGVGILGMISTVISFQCKKNSTYFIFQAGCSIFFSLQFLLMGAWSGLLFNVYGIARAFLLRAEGNKRSLPLLLGFDAYLVAAALVALFLLQEPLWMVALVFAAQTIGTYGMWTKDGRKIRLFQLTVVSPCWFAYDLLLEIPSIGGILCESFNVVSVIVSFVRFRKSGFEGQAATTKTQRAEEQEAEEPSVEEQEMEKSIR